MKIERLRQLQDKIRKIPQAVRAPISAALQQSAEEITQFQRAAVHHISGTLRDSIKWQFGGAGNAGEKGKILGDLLVTISAGGPTTRHTIKTGKKGFSYSYDYAFAEEFGTQKMKGRPFFFPGYRLGRKRAKARIARAANKALKDLK